METNKPRASIHVGAGKKSFSAQMGNEAERRGWDEKRYQSKNAETEKNNHYNFSRKHLNFEPKSVIRISQCCMAVRNPLSFPIWKGMTALFLKTVQDKGYACLLSCPNKLALISIHNGWS